MIAWTFVGLLALAAAKPQLQLREQPLRTQVLTAQQIPLGQTYTSQVPLTQTFTASQLPLGQTYSTSQLPLGQTYSTSQLPLGQTYTTSQLPLTYQQQYNYQVPQTVRYVNYQSAQAVPAVNYRTTQALPAVSALNYQTAQAIPAVNTLNIQSVPAVNTIQYQAPQQLRFSQVRPAVVSQKKTAVVTATAAPVVVPQVKTIQQVVATPQVRTVVAQPLVSQVAAYQQRYAPEQHGVTILRQVQDVQADGTYTFGFEAENGIAAQEEGHIENAGTKDETSVVRGFYSYTSPDGSPINVEYTADKDGFHPIGDHIPKVPEAIQRSLDYLRSLPPRPEDAEGQYTRDENGY